MPNILEAELWVTDIKDTTTTVKSEKEEKIKDHEQVRTITITNGKTDNKLKIVITGKPSLLEGFTIDEIKLKISNDQTQLLTGEEDDD